MKSPCVIVHKRVKMLCHVVNKTLHSVRLLPDVNYGNSLDDSYCIEMYKALLICHISISKVYTLL